MEINTRQVKQWSRLGPRGLFGQIMLSLAADHPELMVLSADLGRSSGLDRFRNTFPDQFINTGIAEQNMIGVAGGLAKEGFTVFATSFSPFIAMRASEHIRMNLGYMQLNVKAVAIGSGISMGFLGNSHFGIEDVAVMRAIPNMTVVNPADCVEVVKCLLAAIEMKGPMYIRLTGSGLCPIVYQEDYPFQIGKAVYLRQGDDIGIVTCGSMVHEALKTADTLAQTGLQASVLNMHTLKPLDESALQAVASKVSLLVTMEEHSIIGGLGSAVSEWLAPQPAKPPLLTLGLPDAFIETGEYAYMMMQQGLTAQQMSKKILTFLGQCFSGAM